MKLSRAFYDRPTLDVARDLLGKVLVHRLRGTTTSGVIVEVEAYIGESDPACHAAPGPTPRNAPLYGRSGFAYVYLNYGIHYMVNIVTEAEGAPAAVLIRALDPLDGVAVMRRRRRRTMKGRRPVNGRTLSVHELCRGPGNVTMAMGITMAQNRADLLGNGLFVEDRDVLVEAIAWSERIGIRVGTDRQWRAYLTGRQSVSGVRQTSRR